VKCFICGKELGIEPNADSKGNYPAELCEKCKADRGAGFNKMNIQRMTELCEKVKPKRHPDPNGVLPLTEEEREEFTELFFDNKDIVNRLYYDGNCIVVEWKEPDNNEFGQLYLDEVSAILYLADKFELGGK